MLWNKNIEIIIRIIIIILTVIAQNLAQWFALQTSSTATYFAVGGLASVGGAEFVLSRWFGLTRWLAIGRSRVRLQFWQVLRSPSNIIWYRRKNRKGNVWLWKERSCAVCKLMPAQGYKTIMNADPVCHRAVRKRCWTRANSLSH